MATVTRRNINVLLWNLYSASAFRGVFERCDRRRNHRERTVQSLGSKAVVQMWKKFRRYRRKLVINVGFDDQRSGFAPGGRTFPTPLKPHRKAPKLVEFSSASCETFRHLPSSRDPPGLRRQYERADLLLAGRHCLADRRERERAGRVATSPRWSLQTKTTLSHLKKTNHRIAT